MYITVTLHTLSRQEAHTAASPVCVIEVQDAQLVNSSLLCTARMLLLFLLQPSLEIWRGFAARWCVLRYIVCDRPVLSETFTECPPAD